MLSRENDVIPTNEASPPYQSLFSPKWRSNYQVRISCVMPETHDDVAECDNCGK